MAQTTGRQRLERHLQSRSYAMVLAAKRNLRALVIAGKLCSVLPVCLLASPAASAWGAIRVDLATVIRLPVQPFGAYGETRFHVAVRPVPSAFSHRLKLPPKALLRTAIAVPLKVWTGDLRKKVRPARFTIKWSSASRSTVLFAKTIDARRKADQKWFEVAVDLSRYAGKTGNLSFSVESPKGSPRFTALWDSPVVLSLAPPLPPNLIVIVLDALRAGHLSVYGYHRQTSRYLEGLGKDGILFLNAFASAPKTIPSVPQLLTATYFPDQVETKTLLELLDQVGFSSTRAIVNNPYVAAWLQQRGHAPGAVVAGDLNARAIGRLALDWLAKRRGEPFFLLLHYLDTHTPYHSPELFANRFVDSRYQGPIGLTFGDVAGAWAGRYNQADKRRIIDLYDGTIRYVDHHIGRLLEKLKRLGLYDNSIIVVTADHGEELWDHGRFFHGQSLYEELLHVPLIVKLPRQAKAGTRIGALARLVDITPSVAALMESATGVAPGTLADPAWSGSPLPGMSGGGREDRALFATVSRAEPNAPPRHAMRAGHYKYILTMSTGEEQLFDLRDDPGEKHNLAAESPSITDKLRSMLAEVTAPLSSVGYQLEISNRGSTAAHYNIGVAVNPPAPFVEVSRIGLEAGDTLAVARHSNGFVLQGSLKAGDADAVRFDILAEKGQCKLVAWASGRPLPASAIRVGHKGWQPQDMPAMIPLSGATLDGPVYLPAMGEGSEVQITFWRKAKAAGESPALTDKMRQRLRSLGYAE